MQMDSSNLLDNNNQNETEKLIKTLKDLKEIFKKLKLQITRKEIIIYRLLLF